MERDLCKVCHGIGEAAYCQLTARGDEYVESLKDCTSCGGIGLEPLPSLFVQMAVTDAMERAVKALDGTFGQARRKT